MSLSRRSKTRMRFDPVTDSIRAAAADVMAEAAAAASAELADAGSKIVRDAHVGSKSLQVHARRAALLGTTAANDTIESGLQAGAQAWRDARRHAVEWGSAAMSKARSRPAAVVVGVAVVGVAVGFWLRSNMRRQPNASGTPRRKGIRA